jgi:hypothetical protein
MAGKSSRFVFLMAKQAELTVLHSPLSGVGTVASALLEASTATIAAAPKNPIDAVFMGTPRIFFGENGENPLSRG